MHEQSTTGRPSGRPDQENYDPEAREWSGRLQSWGTHPTQLECPFPLEMMRVHRATGEMVRYWKPCGRARCQVCGPDLLKKQCAWFADSFSQLSDLKMITLTLDPKIGYGGGRLIDLAFYIGNVFSKKLRARLSLRCERVGARLRYLAVVELSKSGMPHMHALLATMARTL